MALLISGGHTELIQIENGESKIEKFKYTLLGQTRDDAVGEAFDKVARLLGLPYPGGPHISKLAHEAYEAHLKSPIKLPRPMINSGDLAFSFSGLKTAVLYAVREAEKNNTIGEHAKDLVVAGNFKKTLAYEFEQAVTDVLDSKLRQAIEVAGAQSIIVGGGVSANHVLRQRFQKIAETYHIPVFLPSFHISGDNALMIALVAALHSAHNNIHTHTHDQAAIAQKDIHAQGTKKLTE